MIEKMAVNLVEQMVDAKLISDNMVERYVYVAVSWVEKIITLTTVIMISLITKQVIPTIVFLVFFLELRKRTGGYHFSKFYQCYLGTIISYLFIQVAVIKWADCYEGLFLILLFAVGVIEIIGTVNHPNMHMDLEELSESKKMARIMTLLEASIIGGCILLGMDKLIVSYMAIAVILCAVLLCIGKFAGQEVKENEGNK